MNTDNIKIAAQNQFMMIRNTQLSIECYREDLVFVWYRRLVGDKFLPNSAKIASPRVPLLSRK